MINKIIIYLTFGPWLLFFGRLIKMALKETKNKKLDYVWFKKHFSTIMHFDIIILILLFIYFAIYNDTFVDKMLFSVMNLYLFVNTFYDKRNISNKSLDKKDILPGLIIFLISLIPFLLYNFKIINLVTTYIILFIYAALAYILVILIRKIVK